MNQPPNRKLPEVIRMDPDSSTRQHFLDIAYKSVCNIFLKAWEKGQPGVRSRRTNIFTQFRLGFRGVAQYARE